MDSISRLEDRIDGFHQKVGCLLVLILCILDTLTQFWGFSVKIAFCNLSLFGANQNFEHFDTATYDEIERDQKVQI